MAAPHCRRAAGAVDLLLESLHDGKVDGEVAGAARALAGVAGGRRRLSVGVARRRGLAEAVEPLVALIKSKLTRTRWRGGGGGGGDLRCSPAGGAGVARRHRAIVGEAADGAAAVDCASALGASSRWAGLAHAAGGLLLVAMLQPTAGADATATAGLQIDTKLRAGGAQRDVFRELRGIKLLGTASPSARAPRRPLRRRRPSSSPPSMRRRRPPHQPARRLPPAPSPRSLLSRAACRPPRAAEPELLPNAVLAIGSVVDGLAEGGAALGGRWRRAARLVAPRAAADRDLGPRHGRSAGGGRRGAGRVVPQLDALFREEEGGGGRHIAPGDG